MQATPGKFRHLIVDLAEAFVQPLLDQGIEGLFLHLFHQFWRQPIPVTRGSLVSHFTFLLLAASLSLFQVSFDSFLFSCSFLLLHHFLS